MITKADITPRPGGWRILDFGCGTGFASEQILRHLPAEQIASLVCYDLSSEMIDRCREKIAPRLPTAQFTSDAASLESGEPFDLLLTNSLLHHLPDPQATLRQLTDRLALDALWLAGHEPSSRFYKNPDCLKLFRRYLTASRNDRGASWWRNLSSLHYKHGGAKPSPSSEVPSVLRPAPHINKGYSAAGRRRT